MAGASIDTRAAPEAVWAVLAEPFAYDDWVVGSHRIRAADPEWPRPGSGFDHTVGVPPLTIDDRTEVIEAEPPRRLRLLARARPLPTAEVTLELRPLDTGTRVVMVEELADPILNLLAGPLGHAFIKARLRESLRRLARRAEA